MDEGEQTENNNIVSVNLQYGNRSRICKSYSLVQGAGEILAASALTQRIQTASMQQKDDGEQYQNRGAFTSYDLLRSEDLHAVKT